jgi:hypothetical protein
MGADYAIRLCPHELMQQHKEARALGKLNFLMVYEGGQL